MKGTISQLLAGLANKTDGGFLRTVLGAIGDRYASQSLSSAGLVIKAGSSAIVKTGASAYYGIANGRLVTKAAATDMAALSGTVTNARFNVYAFFIDQAGTLTSAMGIEATTLAGVKFPPIPVGKAILGFVIINPTGTGNFVGGTTPLDDATVVPNAAYVNTQGAFDPTVLVS
jgi:hypothetical protein